MPSKTLKAEVRSAVQEYLSSLISERSRPGQGHGMAVSTTDLMVTTKTAGYHGKISTTDLMVATNTAAWVPR